MLSRNLEQTLHLALNLACERRHEYATIEHLLFGLTDDTDAACVLHACGVDLDKLRTDLAEFLDKDLAGLATDRPGDPKPTAGFQRVVQRAAIHVQSSGRDEVTGANVLIALFSERESHAVYFLQSQDMTRLDAVNFISYGIAKAPGRSEPRSERQQADPGSVLRIDRVLKAHEDHLSRSRPEPQPARPGSGLLRTIERVLANARERRHSYATLEHLLLALADDADAAPVLRACGVDLDRLRADLGVFLDKDLAGLVVEEQGDPQPTAGFQRVVRRAEMHVGSSGRYEVTGANVLVALFSERESHAVYFLQSQDMTRLDAVNFIAHGIAKPPRRISGRPEARPDRSPEPPAEPGAAYKVLILNDDVTPIDFVIDAARLVFAISWEDATRLTLEMRRRGFGQCGVYTREVAEAKAGLMRNLAHHRRFPLRCTIEKQQAG